MNSNFQKIIANIKALDNDELKGYVINRDMFCLHKDKDGRYGISQVSHEDIVALAEVFKHNKSTTTFVLCNFRLRDKGAEVLADMLKVNTSIERIDLTGSEITAKGAKALGDALKINTTLRNIDLEDNLIGDEGVGFLMDAVNTKDKTVTLTLKLNNCLITDKGASMLALGVKNNKFSSLELNKNEITDIGAILLANSCTRNDKYFRLNIEDNLYTSFGSKALDEAYMRMKGVIFFDNKQDGSKEELQVSDVFGTNPEEHYKEHHKHLNNVMKTMLGSGDNE